MNPRTPWSVFVLILSPAVAFATAAGPTAGGLPADNQLVSFVSRVTHGSAGAFDVEMPLTGIPGIEDRVANIYVGVASYAQAVNTDCDCYYELDGIRTDADLIQGAQAFFSFSTLTAFKINNVTVNCGCVENTISYGLAYADVDASGVVMHNDKLQVRTNIGRPLTNETCRNDLNTDGIIDQRDGVVVRTYKGRSILP